MSEGNTPVITEDSQLTTAASETVSEVEQLLDNAADSYIDEVVALYEASERNYRAAMMAGTVVNGLSDTTNF